MILTIILILISFVFLFLLYAPIIFEIDSSRRLLKFSIRGIASARLIMQESRFGIELNILGWKKNILPGEKQKPKQRTVRASRFTIKRSTLKKMPRKILAILRSFKVKVFYLNIDTDDYAVNALLYPIAVMLSRRGHQISVNFQGEVELRLNIQNNLQRMLRAYLFT